MNHIVRDGGVKSRKLWFAVYGILMMFLGAVLGARYPTFDPIYTTYVGGVLAIVSVYVGGNVMTKHIGSKLPADPPAADPDEQAK